MITSLYSSIDNLFVNIIMYLIQFYKNNGENHYCLSESES